MKRTRLSKLVAPKKAVVSNSVDELVMTKVTLGSPWQRGLEALPGWYRQVTVYVQLEISSTRQRVVAEAW